MPISPRPAVRPSFPADRTPTAIRPEPRSTDPSDPATESAPAGARLVSTEGADLPLRATRLTATAQGGVARVALEQTFENTSNAPLRVTYQVPMPADAAVSGYAFELEGLRTVGRVESRADARTAFEDAILEGKTAALLEEDRSTVFRQEIGNVPPGATVTVELTLDQRLGWLPEGAWEWRFPTVVAPRYCGSPGRVADEGRVQVPVADGPIAARASLELSIHDAALGEIHSPSHAVTTDRGGYPADELPNARVSFGTEYGVRLDRDVVVRWPVARPEPGATLTAARPEGSEETVGFVTLTPPLRGAGMAALPRHLVLLIDTSGSMGGAPLAQAVSVASALVSSLGDHDRLEMVEFSMAPRRWRTGDSPATAAHRREATEWLEALRAGGGTEMRSGILEALRTESAEAQRQIVLITDGLIGFESEIVSEIRDRLPRGSRVHTLGVGHGVHRDLTARAARAGRGIERIIAPDEDPVAARDALLAATSAPLVVNVELSGDALMGSVPAPRDLMAGAPAILPVALRAPGGRLRVRGQTAGGEWVHDIDVAALDPGTGPGAAAALFARESVQDLEVDGSLLEDRTAVDASIEALGLRFQIATSRTSWVAVSQGATVDPTAPGRHQTMPHELAAGLSAESFGLGRAGHAPVARAMLRSAAAPMAAPIQLSEEASVEYDSASGIANVPAPGRSMPKKRAASKSTDSDNVGPLERLRRATKRILGDEPKEGAIPSPRIAARLSFRGTVRVDDGQRLAVDVALTADLRWDFEGTATLVLGDGSRHELLWDPAATTAAGDLRSGQTLRCVLTGPKRAGDPSQLIVRIPTGNRGAMLELVLELGEPKSSSGSPSGSPSGADGSTRA